MQYTDFFNLTFCKSVLTLDIRVTHPNCASNEYKHLNQIYQEHEKAKRSAYEERVLKSTSNDKREGARADLKICIELDLLRNRSLTRDLFFCAIGLAWYLAVFLPSRSYPRLFA